MHGKIVRLALHKNSTYCLKQILEEVLFKTVDVELGRLLFHVFHAKYVSAPIRTHTHGPVITIHTYIHLFAHTHTHASTHSHPYRASQYTTINSVTM